MGLIVARLVLVVASFGLDRYLLSPWTVLQILAGQLAGATDTAVAATLRERDAALGL